MQKTFVREVITSLYGQYTAVGADDEGRPVTSFTEDERERIRSQLVEDGRELFARFGFERTRIRDVTDAVDIGTSTFYQFFDSKEDLYLEVLCVEQRDFAERLDEALSDTDSQEAEARTVLETMFEEVRTNRLISRVIIENELRFLEEKLSDSDRDPLVQDVDEIMLAYVRQWTENPAFRYDDPAIVLGMLRSAVFTTRAQEVPSDDSAAAEYEAIETNLIDTLVAGLFSSPPASDGDR